MYSGFVKLASSFLHHHQITVSGFDSVVSSTVLGLAFDTRQKANPCMQIQKAIRDKKGSSLTYSLKQGLQLGNLEQPEFTGEQA
jgi:hypothetical protein